MKEIKVTGQKRIDLEKKASKQLRKEGLIPRNLYGEVQWDGKPVALLFTASMSELCKLAYIPHIYAVELIIDDERHTAILKELRLHPATDVPLHVDFYGVNDQEPIVVGVSVKLVGLTQDARDDDRMDMSIRKTNAKALYQQIPEHLDINVTGLRLGKSVKVNESSFRGLELITPEEVVVCSIKATRNSIQAAQATAAAGAE